VPAVVAGFLPGTTAAARVARAYRSLFGTATLQDLPEDPPRFVFNATNLQSTVLWRFSKPYAWDYRVGRIPTPQTRLTTVVAASSAFPPFLSPARLKLAPGRVQAAEGADLNFAPYTTRPVLSDGGVYDNLGLDPIENQRATVLVSDAGKKMKHENKPRHNWPMQLLRVLTVMDNQVRELRTGSLLKSYEDKVYAGTYWATYSDIENFELPDALPAP